MRMRSVRSLALFGLVAILALGCPRRSSRGRERGATAAAAPRLIVLGFDGVDPRWLERYAAEGHLPTLARLMRGHGGQAFRRLASTIPPQSPVAWASFATGTDPGEHGIFDFIRPMRVADGPSPVVPIQGTTTFEQPDDGPPVTTTYRNGIPFWKTLADDGVPVVAINVPYSFPPDPMRHGRMLSGLGVPDLLGINSLFTLATSAPPPESQRSPGGGRIVPLVIESGVASLALEGPRQSARAERPSVASLRFEVRADGSVEAAVEGRTVPLEPRVYSELLELTFREGDFAVKGLVRLLLLSSAPELRVFVTPISVHPREPWFPISHPNGFADDVADGLGHLYKTVGWDHDTSALTAEVVDDEHFLADMDRIETDRREMLLDALARDDFRLLAWVSTAPDRASHMFYRLIDPEHPRYDAALAARHGDAIRHEYERMDETVRLVLAALRPTDTLLVLSDHGFHDYRRGLEVNRFLVQQGYMKLREGVTVGRDFLADVDWSETRAYALGTGQIYLNLEGRERDGIVAPSDAGRVLGELRAKLLALRDEERGGATVVSHVYLADEVYMGRQRALAPDLQLGFAEYYRTSWDTILGAAPEPLFSDNTRKWSGDHSASAVEDTPGILLSNRPLVGSPRIVDLAPTALAFFGRRSPAHYVGRSVLAAP